MEQGCSDKPNTKPNLCLFTYCTKSHDLFNQLCLTKDNIAPPQLLPYETKQAYQTNKKVKQTMKCNNARFYWVDHPADFTLIKICLQLTLLHS